MAIDFDELIHRQLESDTLDYKAHQSWSEMSAAARGKFIRHLTAFANTDGGCLVVGVGEDASGCPCDYTGLTDEETRSFDPSAVGAYINRCVEPPIDFSLERPLVRGKRYAVFVVKPFTVLPHVCTRSVENELQSGVFYIRTKDASSRPAHRAIEMHRLVQRALRNQRELLAKMLRGILYESRSVELGEENPAPPADTAEDAFASSLAYFRRRRSPCPGTANILQVFSVGFDGEAEFPAEALRSAGDAAAGEGDFIASAEIKRANSTNVSLRGLSPDSPRMFQLFRRGGLWLAEYLPAAEGEIPADLLAKRIFGFCRFVGTYYAELGRKDVPLTLSVELSELAGKVVRSGDQTFSAYAPQIRATAVRSADDIRGSVSGCAARLLWSMGSDFGLPDAVLKEIDTRLAAHFGESAQ